MTEKQIFLLAILIVVAPHVSRSEATFVVVLSAIIYGAQYIQENFIPF